MNLFLDNLLLIFLLAFLFILVGAAVYHRMLLFFKSGYMRKKRKQGRKGELIAKKFLIRNGYQIIREQPEKKAVMFIDGERFFYKIRADFLVEKNGKRAVVEVKTGATATDPLYRGTRRQLLEYSLFYSGNELLFFNAETKDLQKIEFRDTDLGNEGNGGISFFRTIKIFLFGVVVGVGLFFILINARKINDILFFLLT